MPLDPADEDRWEPAPAPDATYARPTAARESNVHDSAHAAPRPVTGSRVSVTAAYAAVTVPRERPVVRRTTQGYATESPAPRLIVSQRPAPLPAPAPPYPDAPAVTALPPRESDPVVGLFAPSARGRTRGYATLTPVTALPPPASARRWPVRSIAAALAAVSFTMAVSAVLTAALR